MIYLHTPVMPSLQGADDAAQPPPSPQADEAPLAGFNPPPLDLPDDTSSVVDQQLDCLFKIGPDVAEDIAATGGILVQLLDANCLRPVLVGP